MTNKIKIISVVGARPNFMKIAPIYRIISNFYYSTFDHKICHTGQHYDNKMSDIFFNQLNLPNPDFYHGVGSGSHAEQTGKIMIAFEKVLEKENPDIVLVVGDVNSTIACALTAKKMNTRVGHVEAGLRSFDRQMPEEINRILTDSISDYLFVTERSGITNLKNEGVHPDKIFFVGNCMIDNLINLQEQRKNSNIMSKLQVEKKKYILVTMHRPSNVDSKHKLIELLRLLNSLSKKRKIIFPIHPRTKNSLEKSELIDNGTNPNIVFTAPLGYIDFITLIKDAELILTDSGGIQEESTFFKTQCITLRTSTERPSTIEVGTNQLLGDNFRNAEQVANEILNGNIKEGQVPELWDGCASKRIVDILFTELTS